MSDEHIEVFEDRNEDFQPQQKRGFLRPERNGQTGGQDEDRMNQEDREQGRRKKSNSSWKQRLPMVTGQSREFAFAAPVDLFVFNVNKEVSEDGIVKFMKDSKDLEILECAKVSHEDARTQSFRVKVKAEDYDKALNGDTWPYRVRVRVYRHFKQRRESSGQFAASAGGDDHRRRGEDNQHHGNAQAVGGGPQH